MKILTKREKRKFNGHGMNLNLNSTWNAKKEKRENKILFDTNNHIVPLRPITKFIFVIKIPNWTKKGIKTYGSSLKYENDKKDKA